MPAAKSNPSNRAKRRALELAPESAMRRQPRQVRSQERMNRVLDTAEQVFAEVGYDAATTNLIASQAGTSIGSLYEFFPNKEAIGRALAERYVEQIDGLYANLFEFGMAGEPVEGPALVEHIVEGLDQFYRAHPGAIPLLNGQLTSPDLAAAGARLQVALEERIAAVLELRRPDLAKSKRQLMALVIGDAARSLLARADRVPLSQRRAFVREIETLIIGYLRLVGEIIGGPA